MRQEMPALKGNKLSTKPSAELVSLLKGLLERDPAKRIQWKQLIRHPFWDTRLVHLMPPTAKSLAPPTETSLRISLDRPKQLLWIRSLKYMFHFQ